jgi:hypothetical protein
MTPLTHRRQYPEKWMTYCGQRVAAVRMDAHNATCPKCANYGARQTRSDRIYGNAGLSRSAEKQRVYRLAKKLGVTMQEAARQMGIGAPAPAPKSIGATVEVVLTADQLREIHPFWKSMPNVVVQGNKLRFLSGSYEEQGKALIFALEAARRGYWAERSKLNNMLLQWCDKSPAGVTEKKKAAKLKGAVAACDGAIFYIVEGDEDFTEDGYTGSTLRDWYNARVDESFAAATGGEKDSAAQN